MNDKQKAQLVKLVQMAMQGNLEAQLQIQQIMLFAQQGDPGALQVAGLILQIVQELQGLAPAKRQGGILDYLKYLRGQCPEGYEMQYFKSGGKTIKAGCKKCQQAQQDQKFKDEVEEFKCGRKMKKKAANGAKVPEAKCGKKVKKHEKPSGPLKYKDTVKYNKQSGDRETTRTFPGYEPVTHVQPKEGEPIYRDHRGNSYVNDLDSLRTVYHEGPKVAQKRYPSKKANGGTLTMDDIRTRLGGGLFVPFPRKDQR